MNYSKLLLDSYDEQQSTECPPNSRVEFLASALFGFTTYDGAMDDFLGQKALEVFRAICTQTTSEYIKEQEQYRWYITMCNMPFFKERIDWGTSIRGAWWDLRQPPIKDCWMFLDGKQLESLSFKDDEWSIFSKAVLDFSANCFRR